MSNLTHMPTRHPDLSDEEYRAVCERAAERDAERAENTEDQGREYAEPTPYYEDAKSNGDEGTTEVQQDAGSRTGARNGRVQEFAEPVHPYAQPAASSRPQSQQGGRRAFITVNADGSSEGRFMDD